LKDFSAQRGSAATLGSMTTNLNNQQSGMTLTATFNSRLADQLVRAGLNYKFD
jgi:hypothetical protein